MATPIASSTPREPASREPERPLPRTHVYYALIGLTALAIGVWQIQTSLQLPFALAPAGSNANTPSSNVNAPADVEALKHKDTDGDGLTDYEEQYLYHTSPYLKDSDSDGYDDKTEVTTGNDPLCPHGQSCAPTTFGTAGQTATPTAGPLPANPTAAELRAFLKQSGATDQDLAKYDDAALLQLYHQLVASDSGTATPPSTPSASAAPELTLQQRDAISKLSGAELRQFLIRGGADAKVLAQYDDATLKSFVQQMLSSNSSTTPSNTNTP